MDSTERPVIPDDERRALDETRRLLYIVVEMQLRMLAYDSNSKAGADMWHERQQPPSAELIATIRNSVNHRHECFVPGLAECFENKYPDICIRMITDALGDGVVPASIDLDV